MAQALDLRISGWKVGAATPAIMAERKLDEPIPGPVYEPRCYSSPATLARSDFPSANLETEFAFRLVESIQPRATAYVAEELSDAVIAHAAFDLTQSRFSKAPDALAEIADSGNSGGAVIGPEIPGWRNLDLKATAIALRLDGDPPVETYSGTWRRDPLDVLTWLVNCLSRRKIGLAEGTFVLTGSVTEPRPLFPGICASALFEGAGEVRACIGNDT